MKKTLATLPFHPSLIHAATGKPLQALTILSDGSPLWPFMGGDGEGEGDGGEGEGEGGEGGEGKEGEGKEDEGDESATVPKSALDALQAKFDQLKNQLSTTDKKKSDAEKRLEAQERKERTELENAKKDLETEREKNTKTSTAFKNLAVTNAFLTASAQEKIHWHDPAVAQRAADLSSLEVNEETGEVTGIKDLVKKLAKDNAYLVNTSSGEGDEDGGKNGKSGPSGSPLGSGGGKGKGKKGEVDKEQLYKRFPALRQ